MVQTNEENTAKSEARCTMTHFAREYYAGEIGKVIGGPHQAWGKLGEQSQTPSLVGAWRRQEQESGG